MGTILGYDNQKAQKHRLSNTLDGNLTLVIYVKQAKGETVVFLNETENLRVNAGEFTSPFYCGTVSLPRGEFVLEIQSECEIEQILLGEDLRINGTDEFELQFTNRQGQGVFDRPMLQYTPAMIETLQRHGFFFTKQGDCADGYMPSGVPLGGMGCGKLEICKDGMFTAFTGNNNQDSPIYRMPGSFMAVSAEGNTRILRKDPLGLPWTPVENVSADLEFPFATLQFSDSALPISVSLEAFSAHIPGNLKDSALPCVFFDVTLQNNRRQETDVSFCFSWENTVNVGGSMNVVNRGERILPLCFHTWNSSFVWSDRRYNVCTHEKDALIFHAEQDCGNPLSFGQHLLYCSEQDAVYICDRSISPNEENAFIRRLEDAHAPMPCNAKADEFRAGAWIIRRKLAAEESIQIRFLLSWYMPNMMDANGKEFGVYYTNHFNSVTDVADYALANRDRLYRQTKDINDLIHDSSLPTWFCRRLLDDRFVTATCSWFDKDGDFSINEAPTGMGGCLGTLDQRTASQVYYTAFYPTLDKRELELFRLSQAEDGMCAHDIGFAGLTLEARPYIRWPDLSAAYVIQVYHHYQRTGDMAMLRTHWPHIRKAVDWTVALDDMHCGIPYMCPGRGTTYDNQFWEGINAFISTMQIAAYRIAAACARIVSENGIASEWEALAEKAHKTRMQYLWDADTRYFKNAYDLKANTSDTSCFIASLAGEWATLRAGLAPFLSADEIAAVASSVTEQCVSDRGLTDQGGRRDTTPGFIQYPLAYLASPSIYCGNLTAGWRIVYTTECAIMQEERSTHFDQALTYGYDGNRSGLPYYMTAPASWNVLEALAGLHADCGIGQLTLAPQGNGALQIPVFLPHAWFRIDRSADGNRLTLRPLRSHAACVFRTLTVAGRWVAEGTAVKETVYTERDSIFTLEYDPGVHTLVFRKMA